MVVAGRTPPTPLPGTPVSEAKAESVGSVLNVIQTLCPESAEGVRDNGCEAMAGPEAPSKTACALLLVGVAGR